MDLGLKDKRIIVTGGSRGIGLAIAEACAAEGARVSICARGKEGLEAALDKLATLGPDPSRERHHGMVAHVGNERSLTAYINAAAKELGGLDGLVNNPSGFGAGDSEEAWAAGVEVDLMGVVRATRAAIPMLKESKGSIVNISSISGIGATENTSYGAVKAAVIQLTQSHAKQYASEQVRVNCIAPGSIEFPGGLWDDRKRNAPQHYQKAFDSIPFGRMGTPEEIGSVAAFLLSEPARWVTGQTIAVDGAQNL